MGISNEKGLLTIGKKMVLLFGKGMDGREAENGIIEISSNPIVILYHVFGYCQPNYVQL